ncbi:UPF0175 family protein [Candidatus Woesearchaeota archaeon]|nr:UPF0175 family protein [Candidatus Woesearchaeota archaeon]
MGETVTTRVDDDMAKGIDFFAKREKLDRSTITRRLLARALEEETLDYALELYKKGEITLGRAGEIAGKHLREMMSIASKRGIPFQYSLKSLREDFEAVKKGK